jgi:hypothetical protein
VPGKKNILVLLYLKEELNMRVFKNMREKSFKTPFHAYQFMTVRDMAKILEDIEADKLLSNVGVMFDVNFPIDDEEDNNMTNGMASPFARNQNTPPWV